MKRTQHPTTLLERGIRQAGGVKELALAMAVSSRSVYSWRRAGVWPERAVRFLRLYLKRRKR